MKRQYLLKLRNIFLGNIKEFKEIASDSIIDLKEENGTIRYTLQNPITKQKTNVILAETYTIARTVMNDVPSYLILGLTTETLRELLIYSNELNKHNIDRKIIGLSLILPEGPRIFHVIYQKK